MGQYSHQSNEERAYERLSKELSEELVEREKARELEKSYKGFEESSENLKAKFQGEVGTNGKKGSETLKAKAYVDWYDLSDHEILHLEQGVLQKLIEGGIERAGSKAKLRDEVGLSRSALYYILNEERDTITVSHIKDLLDFLKVPYESIDRHIIGIGSPSNSIKYPHLPFDFDTYEGATLIAAALKDGCISKTGRYLRYANKDRGSIERVKEAVKRVFGHVEPCETTEGSLITITYHSAIIEKALEEAGVTPGKKTEQEYHVPEFIREGDEIVQKAYLYQTLMNEGTWEVSKYGEVYSIKYPQAVSIDKELTEDDRVP